jgi:6-phosphogluconolactonase
MFAYVGSFTTPDRNGRGNGINVFAVDRTSGAWSHVQTLDGLENPSFLVTSADRRFLYAVHGGRDFATAFALDPASGRATLLGTAATGGVNGVRQDFDSSGRFMVVANYIAGNVAVLRVGADGRLADYHDLLFLAGELGPHRIEQTRPHPHDVAFDPTRRFVVIPDKGLDALFVLRFEPDKGRIGLHRAVRTRPGAGPRHIAFHPTLPLAYVCNELDSSIGAYRWDAAEGELTPIQVVPSLPDDFFGANTTAELAFSADGRFLYCSNRGHDSVAIHAIDAASGRLTSVGWQPTQGRDPRFIGRDPTGRFLYATNENGDNVVGFAIDAATGGLTPTGMNIKLGSPVTIAFAGG